MKTIGQTMIKVLLNHQMMIAQRARRYLNAYIFIIFIHLLENLIDCIIAKTFIVSIYY